jgi:hypothetical protein
MNLQAVRALYTNGTLIFADVGSRPRDGMEVVVTFLEEPRRGLIPGEDALQALRGRGRGERLVERLLQSRREDRERDERRHTHLCA